MALKAEAQSRLERFIAVAGSSTFDGEAVNALRAATKLCAGEGITLLDALRGTAVAVLDLKRMAMMEEQAYQRGLAEGRRQGADEITRLKANAAAAQYQNPYAGLGAQQQQAYQNTAYGSGLGQQGMGAQQARHWREVAKELLADRAPMLRKRETEFLQSIIARGFPTLTEKQQGWLDALADRCGVQR